MTLFGAGAQPKRETLTPDQRRDLRSGSREGPGVFLTVAARRAAWTRHREELLAEPRNPGHRPRGWWLFEAKRPRDVHRSSPPQLAELGELTAEELAALEPEWSRGEAAAFENHPDDPEAYHDACEARRVPRGRKWRRLSGGLRPTDPAPDPRERWR
jgi:hypothetical protein